MNKIVLTLAALMLVALAAMAADPLRADTVTLSGELASGTCRDTFTNEKNSTHSASLEYRHKSESLTVRGKGSVSPSGGNCADSSYAHDLWAEKRWPFGESRVYGLVRLGASLIPNVGTYRYAQPDLVIFANETDGSPAYEASAGVGYRLSNGVVVEAAVNVARNDYQDDAPFTAQAGHINATYARDLWGGLLEIEAEVEGPRFDTLLNRQSARWTRDFSEWFAVTFEWVRQGGLDSLKSPFDPTIERDGRVYAFQHSDPTVSVFSVGITATL